MSAPGGRACVAAATFLGVLTLARGAAAQEADTAAGAAYPAAEPRNAERTMNGMTFVYPSTFDTTFITTQFGTMVGVAYAHIPDIDVDGEKFDLALAGIREGFDLGIRLHERIGIFGEIGASALSGIDVETAFLSGATASIDWNVGAMGMLFRNERTGTQVGARLRARQHRPFGGAAAAHPRHPAAGRARRGLGQHGAHARRQPAGQRDARGRLRRRAHRRSGHRPPRRSAGRGGRDPRGAVVRVLRCRDRRPGDHGHETDVGFGVSVGATGHPYFPLGLQAEYRVEVPLNRTVAGVSADTESEHFLGAGLQYTGRRTLQLGLLVGTLLSTEESWQSTVYGDLTMRYFF